MRQGLIFVTVLWAGLGGIWLGSGEAVLDLAFALPDIGPVDDIIIIAVVWAEDLRAPLGVPDWFGALRAGLHRLTGLGG
ncbi:MAG: hypothetical protein JKX69_05150 [Rhodobacteraceae bacterium]|nr:hypothetical protein [Paracoccaceae bacterium]